MKKTTSTKFIIVSVSLLLTLGGIGWACGWFYDDDEATYSLFAPEVIHNSDYQPFFRSAHIFYQSAGYYSNVSDFNLINVQEWFDFFQSKVDSADINTLLYSTSVGGIDSLIAQQKNNSYPLSKVLKKNSLLRYADKTAVNEFLIYLSFAKNCEYYTTYVDDSWGDENSKDNPHQDLTGMDKLYHIGDANLSACKIDFIRQRYIYQLMRLNFYSGNYEACIEYYKENKKAFTYNNTIKDRTMSLAAGALFRTKQYAESNYLFSLLYDKSVMFKTSAYLSFHPMEEADWKASLAMAKSAREKNVLWHILGIYADPLRAMKEIYKTQPESDLLNLLLVRAINIEEEKFVPRRFYEGGAMNDSTAHFNANQIDTKLFNFIKSVADKGNTHKPNVWNMAIGYFDIAMGEYQKADSYFDKALKTSANDTLVFKQIRLLQFVNLIERTPKPNATFEEKAQTELKWLRDEKQEGLRNNNAYEWALKRLAELYAYNQDIIRAECLNYMHTPTFYTDTLKAAQMMAFMDKPDKTKFEEFILSVHPYKKSDIIDYQAVQLAYHYRLDEALAKYKANNITGDELPGNPFTIHINDCHDCDHTNPNKTTYTKVSFLERMVKLQKDVDQNTAEAARSSFLLANGYYNMSYFGNARAMYETRISGFMGVYPFYDYGDYNKLVKTNTAIFDCSLAQKYYHLAMELGTDREFKAKCCFMAAKCEQNLFFMNRPKDYVGDFKAGSYFSMLNADYANTRYFNEIIKECGYFRTYMGR